MLSCCQQKVTSLLRSCPAQLLKMSRILVVCSLSYDVRCHRERIGELELDQKGRALVHQARAASANAAERAQALSASARQTLSAALERAGLHPAYERLPGGASTPDQDAPSTAHFVGTDAGPSAVEGTASTQGEGGAEQGGADADKDSPAQDPWASLRRALAPEGMPHAVRWYETD